MATRLFGLIVSIVLWLGFGCLVYPAQPAIARLSFGVVLAPRLLVPAEAVDAVDRTRGTLRERRAHVSTVIAHDERRHVILGPTRANERDTRELAPPAAP